MTREPLSTPMARHPQPWRVAALAVLLLAPLAHAPGAYGANPEFVAMTQALAKTRRFQQLLPKLLTADKLWPGIGTYLTGRKATFFFPSDSAFAASPKFRTLWNNRRCAPPSIPQACYVPFCLFMIVKGKLSFDSIKAARDRITYDTVQGDSVQKHANSKAKFGFTIGPQVGCGPQCSSRVTGGALASSKPVYQSKNIVVFEISTLLAPPSVWPNGFGN